MESDRILVAAGITAAAVVSAFVFWGPSSSSRPNSGCRLAGLVNMGKTCFLNAIMHALAACPQFISWLECDRSVRETSLRCTLSTVLSVVNGANKEMSETYAPVEVINALRRLGWVIPGREQDAHELLIIILTTLDEETHKASRTMGCLSDALGINELGLEQEGALEYNALGSVMSLNELCQPPSSLNWRGSLIRRNRWISRSCRQLQQLVPPRQTAPHPFSGTLTSQLRCVECGHKSSVRYDKFESLSLALPPPDGPHCRHKLQQLLANFVQPECVNDVQCDGCNAGRDPLWPPKLSKQVKLLHFGKLPICLCIHIARSTWQTDRGNIEKRQDYVQFPMRLSLAAYTYLQAECHQRKLSTSLHATSTSEGGSPLSNSMPMSWGSNALGFSDGDFKHIYQLAAVIVHSGNAYSGHFVTYRRGYQNTKWYFTSDVDIREVMVDEVLRCTAYMLIYEKTTNHY